MSHDGLTGDIAHALGAPFVPGPVRRLAAVPGFLAATWPQLAPSVETAGFLGSALYMADMSLDAVEEVYEPLITPRSLADGGLDDGALGDLVAVLDVFHWVHPQLLLIFAALAEAAGRPAVGGDGRAEPREAADRLAAHRATRVALADPGVPPLPEIAAALGVAEAPDLYRAVARFPRYLVPAWDELQHLVAYPDFRRRGRALYYYARSGARFLARPLHADDAALREAGLDAAAIADARAAIDAALPALATLTMHTNAMRVSLGVRTREVVRPAP